MGVFTNTTSGWQYPNGVAVPPGETRDVTGYNEAPSKPVEATIDNVPEVLKLSIVRATPKIEAITDIDELRALDDIERANQNRQGMLTIIALRTTALDELNPKGSETDPEGSEADPEGSEADPEGSEADPKGSEADPKGSEGE